MQEELHRRITRQLAADGNLSNLLDDIEGKAAEPYAEAMRLLDDDVGLQQVLGGNH